MMKMTWYRKDINTKQDILDFIDHFKKTEPRFSAFDTESDGLHHIMATPFLLAFGYVDIEKKKGYSYTFDFQLHSELEKAMMLAFTKLFKKTEKVVAWNTKFDLHMMHNKGYPDLFPNNITDAMIYVRLAHDALPKSAGGVPMGLKTYAKQYIDPKATQHEKILKNEQLDIQRKNNHKLKEMLKNIPLPNNFKISGKEKTWTIGIINHFLDDNITDEEDLPDGVRQKFQEWMATKVDHTNYANLNRTKLTKYAHYDIIYTLETFIRVYPVAKARGQKTTIKREEKLIHPLYTMERVGFRFNRKYALAAKKHLKQYIKNQRKYFKKLIGSDISVNQHKKIKEIFKNKYNIYLSSTGKQILSRYQNHENTEVREIIKTILEIRTLEKWYSTYIVRWIDEEIDGRIYTTIQQNGAVSGRVSSNFQQFPNNPIKDRNGNELFHPRRMVKTTGDPYNKILLIDYSQIELRIQAIYTLLISGGDTNLCRAYIPFKCINRKNEEFDPYRKEHLDNWNSGGWYLKEQPDTEWKPIDLHTATTLNIFTDTRETDKNFKRLRKIGKMTNFACNYGASPEGLASQLDNDIEMGRKAFQGYMKTFPKVAEYRQWVKQTVQEKGYVENLFGRRYYNASAHNAQNYLVQGSAADFLKQKIIEVHNYLRKNGFKTRMQMNIHDEISFELHKDEEETLPDKLKAIMEQLDNSPIPIVADKEYTDTTWDEKRDMA